MDAAKDLNSGSGQKDGSQAVLELLDRFDGDMQQVNALILSRADSHVEMVPELARHLIDAGGKRLRPLLTLASAHMVGNPENSHISYAAAIEFMHNATLLHDDVVDESDMRRGKPAARTIWGNQASVLVGDFLLGQAFMMMVEAGSLEALSVLSEAAAIIAEGEVFQLAKANRLDATQEDYLEIISAKTAKLFEAACRVGAMAGNGSAEEIEALAAYGDNLGMAFQLVDDVLDYGSDLAHLGKNVGDDLREGKMTLPIIRALAVCDAGEKELIKSCLGDEGLSNENFLAVRAVLQKYDALSGAMDLAKSYVAKSVGALNSLPVGDLRENLAQIAEFCLKRTY